MKTQGQLERALAYFDDLTRRSRDYWDELTVAGGDFDPRYQLYQEYKAKREALEWVLGKGDAPKAAAPPHSIFPPDFKR